MVQTLTVRSNSTVEINTGSSIYIYDGTVLTQELQDRLDAIESEISAEGISELHVERDTFREFEHVVKAGEVSSRAFGSTVSVENFDWIMGHVDAETPPPQVQGENTSEPELL